MTAPGRPRSPGALPLPLILALVAVGGAAGALLRWGLGEVVPVGGSFPWVTLAINVAGCFVLAALPAVGAVRRSEGLTLLIGPGLLGGFTTVSSWAHETRTLVADGDTLLAGAYVVGTLTVCLAAATAGRALTQGMR